MGGHYANWEFLNHLEHYCDYTFIAIYKPLNNKYFDRLVQQKQEEPNMITETHVRMLERLIREEPAYWLWSHNRWKFSFEDFKKRHPNSKP